MSTKLVLLWVMWDRLFLFLKVFKSNECSWLCWGSHCLSYAELSRMASAFYFASWLFASSLSLRSINRSLFYIRFFSLISGLGLLISRMPDFRGVMFLYLIALACIFDLYTSILLSTFSRSLFMFYFSFFSFCCCHSTVIWFLNWSTCCRFCCLSSSMDILYAWVDCCLISSSF